MFQDNPNLNQRLYRGTESQKFQLLFIESEAFVKISKDRSHLRSDNQVEVKVLYEPAVQPYSEFQRRFPMLRDYEKAKASVQGGSSIQDFEASIQGAKSNRKDNTSDVLKITQQTFNHKVRQKQLLRASNGLPLSKVRPPSQFIPNNPGEAKESLKANNFGLYWDEYENKRKQDFEDHLKNKNKMVGGIFRQSYYNDNSIAKKKQTGSLSRLRMSGDSFIATNQNFNTFLQDKEELPRLSILQNYNQIARIMTSNYIKSMEYEKKFRNRDQRDVLGDEDYVKFKEEEINTKKMSTILKSLNSPRRKTAQSFNRTNTTHLRQASQTERAGINKAGNSFAQSFYKNRTNSNIYND